MTRAQAETALEASKEKALAMGRVVSISVVDVHGELLAFSRFDGAGYVTADIACGKAMVAAIFRRSSGTVADKPSPAMTYQQVNAWRGNRLVYAQGGVPVSVGGVLLGAVGVSGAKGAEDEEIAVAGAEAVARGDRGDS